MIIPTVCRIWIKTQRTCFQLLCPLSFCLRPLNQAIKWKAKYSSVINRNPQREPQGRSAWESKAVWTFWNPISLLTQGSMLLMQTQRFSTFLRALERDRNQEGLTFSVKRVLFSIESFNKSVIRQCHMDMTPSSAN